MPIRELLTLLACAPTHWDQLKMLHCCFASIKNRLRCLWVVLTSRQLQKALRSVFGLVSEPVAGIFMAFYSLTVLLE